MDKKAGNKLNGADFDPSKPLKPTITIPETNSTLSSASTVLDFSFDMNKSRTTSATSTAATSADPNSASDLAQGAPSAEILAVGELLGTMRQTLRALGTTFTLLGKQTEKVASLAPAIKAAKQITELRERLQVQMAEHEHKIKVLEQELEKKMRESLKGVLRDDALALVKESIAKRVEEAVAKQLKIQISDKLRQQAQDHPQQILELEIGNHNAEARSYNSALRSATDPLRPLLCPLPALKSPDTKCTSPTCTPAARTVGDVPRPTPSAIFPTNLKALFSLSAADAQRLLDEYGIKTSAVSNSAQSATVSPISPQSASSSGTMVEGGDVSTREEDINRFMIHIGLSFRLLPVPASVSSSPVGQKLGYRVTSIL